MSAQATIYAIINLVDGRAYVGSSVKLANRWSQHRANLRMGNHRSKLLQEDYNKHGPEAFSYVVLEVCEIEIQHSKESDWCDILSAFEAGYNTLTPGKGHKYPADFVQRRGAAIKKAMSTLAYRAKRRKIAAEVTSRPDYRAKQSLVQTLRQNPFFK